MTHERPALVLADMVQKNFQILPQTEQRVAAAQIGNFQFTDCGDWTVTTIVDEGDFILQYDYSLSDPEFLSRASCINKHTGTITEVDRKNYRSFIRFMLKSIQ